MGYEPDTGMSVAEEHMQKSLLRQAVYSYRYDCAGILKPCPITRRWESDIRTYVNYLGHFGLNHNDH